MFDTIFNSGNITAVSFFIALGTALGCGILFSFLSCYKSKSSSSFFVCTSLLPMAVAAVIALVNGNLGIGVAIAGAFGLVRFRSAPGSAREIAIIFIAMVSGLAFGMGYLAYGAIFLLFCGILLFVFEHVVGKTSFGKTKEKIIKVTIPESLDYSTIFDDLFNEYLSKHELEKVKSVNMGSMFRLTYRVTLKDETKEKAFLDEIRMRNGNLEIQCLRADLYENEL